MLLRGEINAFETHLQGLKKMDDLSIDQWKSIAEHPTKGLSESESKSETKEVMERQRLYD